MLSAVVGLTVIAVAVGTVLLAGRFIGRLRNTDDPARTAPIAP